MRPYASTLHHLTLTGGMCLRNLKLEDGMSLEAFSHLRTLHLMAVAIREGCLRSALGAMPLLVDLSIFRVFFLSDALSLPTFSHPMTRLTSFEFRAVSWNPGSVWHWIRDSARKFLQLTKLSFEFPTPTFRLPSSKTVTHLTVRMIYPMAPEKMLQMTEIMPRLESLNIYARGGTHPIPSCMFLKIKGLRSLRLDCVDVELDFFDVLASLEHLTALRLWCQDDTEAAHSVRFYAEVNRLTNLLFLRLKIQSPYRSLVLEHLSGVQLNRLQELELFGCRLDYDQRDHLFSRFPSLRRFSSM